MATSCRTACCVARLVCTCGEGIGSFWAESTCRGAGWVTQGWVASISSPRVYRKGIAASVQMLASKVGKAGRQQAGEPGKSGTHSNMI